MLSGSRQTRRAALALVANLLPIAGIVRFGWQVHEVLFAYWIELGLPVGLYCVLALFAKREPMTDERTVNLLRIPGLSSRDGASQPIDRLPIIYYRNVECSAGTLVFGLAIRLFASHIFVILAHPDGLLVTPEAHQKPLLTDHLARIAWTYTPGALGVGLVLFAVRFASVRREFFHRRRYAQVSAPMTAEIPVRQAGFWLVLSALATFSIPIVTLPLVVIEGLSAPWTVAIVAVLVILSKLVIEGSTLRERQFEERSGVARLFTPEDPSVRPTGPTSARDRTSPDRFGSDSPAGTTCRLPCSNLQDCNSV